MSSKVMSALFETDFPATMEDEGGRKVRASTLKLDIPIGTVSGSITMNGGPLPAQGNDPPGAAGVRGPGSAQAPCGSLTGTSLPAFS